MFDTTQNPQANVELPVDPVSEPVAEALEQFGQLQAESYEDFKRSFLKWLLTSGKNPDHGDGYAPSTVSTTHYFIGRAYRWKWEESGEFTTDFTPKDADSLIRLLHTRTTQKKSTVAKYQKALKRLFAFKNQVKGKQYSWDPSYISDQGDSRSHHYFKKHELGQLYDAAIEIGSFVSYHNKNLSSDGRDRAKAHLAQRFGIPKDDVGPEEFQRANSWKFPSLVAVCCDTGLRPIEVKRSNISWLNLKDAELVIPKTESSKGSAMWECALSSQTVSALERWLNERSALPKYDGRDEIWLTRHGNPYESHSLNQLLDRLLDEAKIDPRNRNLTWYSIRRGVATLWANDVGVHHAKAQLRHKHIETTMKYIHSDSGRRQSLADNNW